jgi:uncharacterized protein (DUF934 family)
MAKIETPVLHPGARRIIRVSRGDVEEKAEIVVDHWQRLDDDAPLPSFDALPVLVSTRRAARQRAELDARAGGWGVWTPGDGEPREVAEAFGDRPLIAVLVPKFTDGRHYSLARLLRERHGYAGDLRAVGDVLPDQLFYMRRCGYSSFELAPGKSLETGLRALAAFSVSYQAAADDPRPLFRRRA